MEQPGMSFPLRSVSSTTHYRQSISSHVNSKPPLDLSQANTGSDVLPTLQIANLLISVRRFVHANSQTCNSSGQSFFVAVVFVIVAIDDAGDGEGEDVFELCAHGLGGLTDALGLLSTVAAEDSAREDLGLGERVAW